MCYMEGRRGLSGKGRIGGGRVRGLAPGFYLRCPPAGAAPRICRKMYTQDVPEEALKNHRHSRGQKIQKFVGAEVPIIASPYY